VTQRLRATFQAAPAAPDQKSQSHEWCSGFSQFLFGLEMSCLYWHVWYKFNTPDLPQIKVGTKKMAEVLNILHEQRYDAVLFSVYQKVTDKVLCTFFFLISLFALVLK
jgi:hypothetical protein